MNGVSNVPTPEQILAVLPQSNTIRVIDPNLQAPYTMQAALSIDRQLPFQSSVSLFYMTARTVHVGRLRNINAPICPEQINCQSAPRPDPTLGSIYQYEASGIRNENRMFVRFQTRFNPRFTMFANYSLGFSKSDADGFGSFPSYSYDLNGEYGRAGGDVRHTFMVMGSVNAPWGISLNPHVIFRTGSPFNITRGLDRNADGLFTERPTFGELQDRCSQLNLTQSFCDIGSNDPNSIIPRNYGEGPSFFTVNMRIGKNFGFGKSAADRAAAAGGGGGDRRGGGGGGRPGAMGGGPGGMVRMGGGPGGFGGESRKPYNLNVNLQISNLFNNVNFAPPIGNLNSSRFGQSTSTMGSFGGFGGFGGGGGANRRIELQMRFTW